MMLFVVCKMQEHDSVSVCKIAHGMNVLNDKVISLVKGLHVAAVVYITVWENIIVGDKLH